MAPKRQSPIEDPPAASSSEEELSDEEIDSGEEEESESEPEPEQKQQDPAKKASIPLPVKKPEAAAASVAKAEAEAEAESSSDDEEGTESESESDSVQAPVTVVNPTFVVASSNSNKPMHDNTFMIKKARTKASSMPVPVIESAKPVAKRPIEKSEDEKDSKRAKDNAVTTIEPESNKAKDDSKKPMFQRLWSEDDEIVILKGMIEYIAKERADPYSDVDAFHDLIKKGLHIDVTRVQLMDKMRRLKKKFGNNSAKKKNGDDRTFSKPFEQKCFDLSKKIWGNEANAGLFDQTKSNGKAKKVSNQKVDKKVAAVPAAKQEVTASISTPKETIPAKKEPVPDRVTLGNAEVSDESFLLEKSINGDGSNANLIREGLSLIGNAKKAELVKKWKKLQCDEAAIYLRRIQLAGELTKLALDACKHK